MNEEGHANRLERFRLSGALWGWSYAFARPSPVVSFPTFGLEIGIALSGERFTESPTRGAVRYGRGRVSTFDLGEHYKTRYVPNGSQGREIGFLLRTDRIQGWTSSDRFLRFPCRTDFADGRLVDLAESIADAVDRHDAFAAAEVEAEVRRFVERHGELVAIDPLERARLELVRHFDRALYMRHFAEIAGVHEETFARKFATRYGVTPTRYRCLVRLKEAALLLATQPDTSVREVAKRVGFEDPAYFHRAFSTQFGATPLGLARGFTDRAAA